MFRGRITPARIRIVSADTGFAQSIARRLERWGLIVSVESDFEKVTPALLEQERADVVLLDVREHEGGLLRWLSAIKQTVPAVEVIVLNRAGEIALSIEGMRAGASHELHAPLDTATLRRTLSTALRRRHKRLEPDKPSLLERFQQVMTAATFAQAGEFDTAREILEEGSSPAKGRGSSKERRQSGRASREALTAAGGGDGRHPNTARRR